MLASEFFVEMKANMKKKFLNKDEREVVIENVFTAVAPTEISKADEIWLRKKLRSIEDNTLYQMEALAWAFHRAIMNQEDYGLMESDMLEVTLYLSKLLFELFGMSALKSPKDAIPVGAFRLTHTMKCPECEKDNVHVCLN